jgi:DNA-binding CsgD family transcriptional regulator
LFGEGGVEDPASEVERPRVLVPGAPVRGPELGLYDLRVARRILRAGASGFLHLGMEPSQIVRALSVTLEGQLALPRELLNRLIVGENTFPSDLADLTVRQREILELVAEGMSNTQIARRLFLSESTIKQHLRAAYKILKVRNRTEAAKLFRDGRRYDLPERSGFTFLGALEFIDDGYGWGGIPRICLWPYCERHEEPFERNLTRARYGFAPLPRTVCL